MEIPLELAELLHATLGPLNDRLRDENHFWAPLVARVLDTYRMGRDEAILNQYGPAGHRAIRAVTVDVAENVCRFVDEIGAEEADFTIWTEEIANGNASTDG